MQQLSTHDTAGPIDFDNLNIIIRPKPPRRRLSGTSIIPFRPYVKRLTSVRQEFSFANGQDEWTKTGDKEPFFNQENARCIGSLIDDCGISEVIRWDIEGESTRLPMMCKLWMIVDGAVVERGKPHMVQDAAVQVFIAGRSRASILSAEQQHHYQTHTRRYDRRRRHSWHDVNEYHSVPYFQYTSSIRSGYTVNIQCDMDNEHLTSKQEFLPFIKEEIVFEEQLTNVEKHRAQEKIQDQSVLEDQSQISITTQTEDKHKTRSTSIDSGITLSSYLNLDTNDNVHHGLSNHFRDIATATRDDIEYSDRSVATRDDKEYSLHSVATGDDIEYSQHSVATGNDIEYSQHSVATGNDAEYSQHSVATGNDIEYSQHSVATGSDIEYSNQSVASGHDIEYLNQSVSTRDDKEYSDQSVAADDGIKYLNQSVSTHDDVEYLNQSVSTRDDIEYSDRSVATHDDKEYSQHSVATGNDIEYSQQCVASGHDIEYANQSVSTRDDVEYLNRSVATHDDIEYSNQSVATRDDVEYLNRSVSTHDDIEYSNRSIATGDDYPDFWLQFSTNELLSDYIIQQSEHKERTLSGPSPRQHDQSIQTDTEPDTDIESEKPRRSSSRSSHFGKSSSSATLSNQYEVTDQVEDENHSRKSLPFISHRERIDSHGDLDSRSSDYQLETSSNHDYNRSGRATSSSKQSDTGYNSFRLALNQQSYSTPDPDDTLINETSRTNQTKTSESTSPNLLQSLSERYEKTLRTRQRAIAVINDELLDIDDVLKRYREKIRDPVTTQSDRAIQISRDITSTSYKPREERPSSPVSSTLSPRITYHQYITNEDILQDYIPSPRMYMTDSLFNSPRQSQLQPNYSYCDLCLTDHSAGSAWIRYNEQRIDQLQQRMDLMLEIDESDEAHFTLSTLNPIRNISTQRMDDILIGRTRRRNQSSYSRDRTSLPRRSNFRLPCRSNSIIPTSPRFSPRNPTRSIIPASKRVRISTNHVLIPNQTLIREPILPSKKPVSRPIVSILRRNDTSSQRSSESSHLWENDLDRNMFMLEQSNIPRYYRLYSDAGFREVYDFSRMLDLYLNRINSRDYSSIIQNFALENQLPRPITAVA